MTCRIHGPLVVEPRSIRVYVAPGVTCVVVWICGRPGGPSGSPPDGPLKGRASVAPRAGEADRAGGIPSARTTSVTRPRTMRCILNTPPPPEASPRADLGPPLRFRNPHAAGGTGPPVASPRRRRTLHSLPSGLDHLLTDAAMWSIPLWTASMLRNSPRSPGRSCAGVLCEPLPSLWMPQAHPQRFQRTQGWGLLVECRYWRRPEPLPQDGSHRIRPRNLLRIGVEQTTR